MSENTFWLGFSAFPGIGPKRFQTLLETFGSAKDAWFANEDALRSAIGKAITGKFLQFKKQFSLEKYEGELVRRNIATLFLKDDNYPKLLKKLSNAPFVLYIKGDQNLVSADEKTIAVVGTRKCTAYGREVTTLLTRELVENGCVIVSGLAIGVDSVAHQAAIAANGETIAVLGCGVSCCTPGENLPTYDKIVERFGAVVSESAFGTGASKGIFPARNRVIAGLSLGVVVTEGAEDSGALITAERARELKRPVFAVPGPITSQLSKGPNTLAKSGAKIITGVTDILESLGLQTREREKKVVPVSENQTERQIIKLLANEAMHFNDIVHALKKNATDIAQILSIMEVKGMVKSTDGGTYSLN